MYKVLLLSNENDSKSFLSIVRSLGKKDISIHTTFGENTSPALYSRYIKKKIPLPNYFNDNKRWLSDFISLLKKESYTLIIPCDDLSIISLELNRIKLSKHANIYILDSEISNIINNKYKTSQLASSLNINVPKNILIKDKYSITKILTEFNLPLVLKPVSSFTKHSSKRHDVITIHSKEKLEYYIDLMLERSHVQVQSYFTGTGVSVNLLAKNGSILSATQHERLHEPFSGGGSSYRKSTLINKELLEASEKIISKLKYTGVAMIEFKYNFRTQQWVLLEINGRFWGSLPLSISSGVDYPYLLFLTLLEKKLPLDKIKYKSNIYQRNLTSDLHWHNDAFFNVSKNDLAAQNYSHKSLLWEFFRLLSCRDKVDSFSILDPLPFIVEVSNIITHIIYTISKKIRFKLLRNKCIRRQIKKKLMTKLLKANNILFICKGNICRSPFAQQAARKLWPTIPNIKSSGYYKKSNRNAPEIAIRSALELDVHLLEHNSTVVDLTTIKNADIIFYFDEENRNELFEKFAAYKRKMYALNFLSENLPIEIEDPIDKNETDFLETYKGIYQLLKSIPFNK